MWDPQQALDDLSAAQAADRVYASMDDLAAAFHARVATLTDMPDFLAWQRSNPAFKPSLSGFLWTAQGPRLVTVLPDTGATHCFRSSFAHAWPLHLTYVYRVNPAPPRSRRQLLENRGGLRHPY